MMLKNKTLVGGAIAVAGMAAAVLASAGVQWSGAFAQTPPAQMVRASGAPVFGPPPGAPMSFADIIERVSPAVVSIETRSKVTAQSLHRAPLEIDPDADPNQPTRPAPRTGPKGQPLAPDDQDAPEMVGAGSGFFISADGYIVTNNHVVENADEITVTMTDKRELKAKVVGRDAGIDLAVIKVEGSGFPYVEFETKAKPRVGDWVIAVGNPFGLGGTATAGIVSANGRDIGEQYVDYIQVDAPINRGNSGGPTFDIYGRVIGVNTAILSPNGASAGIGLAIPADIADAAAKQLIAKGHIDRGYLGVTITSLSEDIQKSLGRPTKLGAYVTDVTPGGPSDKGGVKVGDIILKLNGVEVKDNTDLTRHVALAKPGDILRLDVLRGGKEIALNVRSGLRPTDLELTQNGGQGGEEDSPSGPAHSRGPAIVGLIVDPLTPSIRKEFNIPSGTTGVVISDVVAHSQAAKIGLKPGDLILMADSRQVATPTELQAIVAEVKASGRPSVLLLIQRDGRNTPVPVPFTPAPK